MNTVESGRRHDDHAMRGDERLHNALAVEFASVSEPADLLRLVVMRAVVETVSDRGIISWLDGEEMVVADCYDPFGEAPPVASRWALEASEVARLARNTGLPASAAYELPDIDMPAGLRESYSGLRQIAVAPVIIAGEAIALLAVSRRRTEDYSDDDTTALHTIAQHAAQPLFAARLQEELTATRAMLDTGRRQDETVERVKTDILQLASHELRTPLTVLNGYLALIDAGFFGEVPEQLAGIFPILVRRVADMNELVNDMLVAARVEAAATLEPPGEAVDLRLLVEQAVASVRPRAVAEHDLMLEMPDRPVPVIADSERVLLAVRNIVDNAVKYSPDGGEVRCTLEVGDIDAVVRVSDEGLGIAPDDRDRLFTRFGRILTTSNSNIPGIGLGLYFSREVARRHGGDVEFVDDGGTRTIFELRLPVAAS